MQRRAMIRSLLAAPLAPALLASSGRAEEPAEPMALDALLDRFRRVYAEANTYRDTGVVTDTFFKPDGEVMMETKKPFSTAFVRPDRFRFEYDETEPDGSTSRYLIARDAGGEVRTWWDVEPGVEIAESLSMALAAATGVSSSSANTVPRLLLRDELGGRDWTLQKTLERLDDAETAGRRCHRVRYTVPPLPRSPAKGAVSTYWVDAASFLLRRVETSMVFPDFFTESITTYEPVLNGEVPDAALAFDPPEAKKAN